MNQLIKIENRNGSTEYRYDPLGRRTAKIRNGEITVYHWQEDTLAIESTNGQNTHYLFEPGTFEPLAQFQTTSPIGIEREDKPAEPYSYDPETDPLLKIPPEPQGQSEVQPELVYYQLDHLGTPIAAHNAKGEAVWTVEYEAWGRIRNETVSDDLKANIPFRFQGQYYDEESGLHYNRFRYYDPEIGRFVSQDPIGLMGGINLFEYAPNPIVWVDPLGLKNYRDKFWERAGEQDRGKYQVHHIIPQDIFKKEDSGNILRCHGMDVDNLGNLIGLPRNINDHPRKGSPWFGNAQHNSKHEAYSGAIRRAIVRIGSKGSCLQQKSKLLALQKSLRRMLQRGEPIMKSSDATDQQWDGLLRGY